MANKFVQFERGLLSFSASMIISNKVALYVGKTDHWGIGFNINFYDRSINFEILNLYFGVEVWYGND